MEALEQDAFMEEEEDGGVLDSTLSHLERIVADATKYLGNRARRQ